MFYFLFSFLLFTLFQVYTNFFLFKLLPAIHLILLFFLANSRFHIKIIKQVFHNYLKLPSLNLKHFGTFKPFSIKFCFILLSIFLFLQPISLQFQVYPFFLDFITQLDFQFESPFFLILILFLCNFQFLFFITLTDP